MRATEEWLDDAVPCRWRAKHPGEHRVYVYGQQSADGSACMGCEWQHPTLDREQAEALHAAYVAATREVKG